MVVTLIGCHSSFLLFFLLISSFVAFFSSHSVHLKYGFDIEHEHRKNFTLLVSRSRMGHGEALPVAPEVEAAESVGGEGVNLLQAVAEDLVTHAVGSKHHGEDQPLPLQPRHSHGHEVLVHEPIPALASLDLVGTEVVHPAAPGLYLYLHAVCVSVPFLLVQLLVRAQAAVLGGDIVQAAPQGPGGDALSCRLQF